MTPGANTPLPPEPDWIELLRERRTRPLAGNPDLLVANGVQMAALWPLLCDVVEAAYNFDARFEERLKELARPQNDALAALRAEVERDG